MSDPSEPDDQLLSAISQLLSQLRDTQVTLKRTESQLGQARKKARAGHLRYYDLFELAPDAYVVTDPQGMVLQCNQAMSDLIGRKARWIVGKPLAGFFALEDRPAFRRVLGQLSKSDERQDREVRLSPNDGQRVIYVQASVRPVRDSTEEIVELRWLLRDITGRKRAEAALAASEARHRFLTEHAQDAIYLFSLIPKPHLEYISPAIEQITGYKPEQFYRDWKLVRKLLYPEDAGTFNAYLRSIDMMATPLMARVVKRKGEIIWIEQHATIIRDDAGAPVAVEAIVRDVTERIKAEAQLDRLRTEFLVILAHEFRTPLTGIKGAAAIGLSSDEPPKPRETHELFEIIDEQAEKLRHLISNLLDVTQIESGMLSLHTEDVDMAAVLEEAREAFARTGEAHKVVLELPQGLPHLKVDRRRIRQVLNNLLTNAAQVSPAAEPIVVSARREEDAVLVQVRDNGRGIPPDKLPLLFRKFYKVDEVADAGAGLGLAICKGLVEAHGGRIWAESDGQGNGAVFTVALPAVA